jgi:hypothetical protein
VTGGGGSGAPPARIGVLHEIAGSGHEWPVVAARWGVQNPAPPWETSLQGMLDALDAGGTVIDPVERRQREDDLCGSLYAHLPDAEARLLALAHTLVARGVVSEEELALRVRAVTERRGAA